MRLALLLLTITASAQVLPMGARTAFGGAPAVQISFDVATRPAAGDTNADYSWSHTTGSLTNGILLVSLQLQTTTDIVTAVTYNGVSMTRVLRYAPDLRANGYIYYLAAPASGTHTINVTFSEMFWVIQAASASYGNASQSTPSVTITGRNPTNPANTDFPTTLTTVDDRSWTFLLASVPVTQDTLNAGASTTARVGGGQGFVICDSNGPKSPAGSTTLNVQTGSIDIIDTLMIAISPSS